jgi:hypothetical protein
MALTNLEREIYYFIFAIISIMITVILVVVIIWYVLIIGITKESHSA